MDKMVYGQNGIGQNGRPMDKISNQTINSGHSTINTLTCDAEDQTSFQ